MSKLLTVSFFEFGSTPRQKIAMRNVMFIHYDFTDTQISGVTFSKHIPSINLVTGEFICTCRDRSCRSRACKHVLKLYEDWKEIKVESKP